MLRENKTKIYRDMNKMSDGKSDGIILMYVKDGVVYPVGLTKSQLEMLNLAIGIGLNGRLTVFEDKPIGAVVDLTREVQ